ncbi:hypothetical protein SDC9_125180 [bioreactor metagenome]|uniref:Uncharacterized protein n=1 Tax=bioreactor metagenome TaxID=1076179 RepID=A0A645CMP8_9ZZZZ
MRNSASRAPFHADDPLNLPLSMMPEWCTSKAEAPYFRRRASTRSTKTETSFALFSSPPTIDRATVSMIIRRGFPTSWTIRSTSSSTNRAECSSMRRAARLDRNRGASFRLIPRCLLHASARLVIPAFPSPAR